MLVSKLNIFKVNICSIADHDSFDYKLYKRLKEEEGKGSIVKVLPAVEFTVHFDNPENKVHIVTIFNDLEDEKVKKIESKIPFDINANKPNYKNGSSFSENEYIEILNSINLDVICIAHQKNTLTSKSNPKENDANSVGDEKFNELLFSEYFEAFEFKNRKNQVFNNYSKSKLEGDILRFITGSDCHEWQFYPKHSAKSNDDDFRHTFVKCLPSFRGLALALTDDTRINLDDNFFNTSNFYLKEINIELNGKKISVPLSRGINAIIGDNSIGKSLLLHKITDYYRLDDKLSPMSTSVKNGYEKYLSQHKIKVGSKISKTEIFAFDTQGEIRKKFDLNKLKDDDFFKDKYPKNIDTSRIEALLKNELEKVISYLSELFLYYEKKDNLMNLQFLLDKEVATSITLIDTNTTSLKKQKTSNQTILTNINNSVASLETLMSTLNNVEQKKIQSFIDYLNSIHQKYNMQHYDIENQLAVINCINTEFNNYKSKQSKIKSTADANLEHFIQNEKVFVETISELLHIHHRQKKYESKIEDFEVSEEKLEYLKYSFIKRTNVTKFDNKYLNSALHKPFDGRKKIKINSLKSINEFKNALKGFSEGDAIEYYKTRILEQFNIDLTQNPVINMIDERGKQVVYSSGLNSQIYFEVLSSDRYRNGIYIIDQPEDDVSPRSIKSHLLDNFKEMSRNRQIILVTHNPQFVVNLDVDNVVIFTKNNGIIDIESGALEYQDTDTDILNRVATLLDGGIDTIRKRWKRYAKN